MCSIRSKFPNKLPVRCLNCYFTDLMHLMTYFHFLLHVFAPSTDHWCVFLFRWLLNVTSGKRPSLFWTKQSSWFPLSSPWVSSSACSGKWSVATSVLMYSVCKSHFIASSLFSTSWCLIFYSICLHFLPQTVRFAIVLSQLLHTSASLIFSPSIVLKK